MPNTHTSLVSLFDDIADAIRAKTGGSASIVADNFPTEISNIPSGGGGISADDVINKSYSGVIYSTMSGNYMSTAFSGWNQVSGIDLPNVTFITNSAFQGTGNNCTVSLASATTIGAYAFQNSGVVSISAPNVQYFSSQYSNGDNFYQSAIQVADFPSCRSLAPKCFSGCTSLTTASFPMATTVDQSSFYACTALTTVNFPSASVIEQQAFYGCSALESIELPACNKIDNQAFYYCSSLKTLTLGYTEGVVTLAGSVFNNTPIASLDPDAHIYVPASLVSAYQADSVWSTFSSIISAIPNS